MTDKKIKRKKTQSYKGRIIFLFFLVGITTVLLIRGTYAWFVGMDPISIDEFQIDIFSRDSLELSLDGNNWSTELDLTKDAIMGTAKHGFKAYTGHTNMWPSGDVGLIPLSSIGESDPAANGRLILYGKSDIAATGGGYKFVSTRINNYGTSSNNQLVLEQDGYIAFDLFIKNGEGVDYISTYNQKDDEALYLATDSKVTAVSSGEESAGIENSLRLAFVQIGRIATNGATSGDVAEIGCSSLESGSGLKNTSLCNQPNSTIIWEPNETIHYDKMIEHFNKTCKTRKVYNGSTGYSYGSDCIPLKQGEAVKTFAIAKNISTSNYVDAYDGLNGFMPVGEGENDGFLKETVTFTDKMKSTTGEDRPVFMYIAPNSITKVRVYIYLESQDVDSYDLTSLGKTIKFQFGFTKDQWNLDNKQEEK